MKSKKAPAKPSAHQEIDTCIEGLKPPVKGIAASLKEIILNTDEMIGGEIKWNAPSFFYKGEMKAFDAKEYKRHIVVFNFSKKNTVRLVFISGAKLEDASGLLQGTYTDGRRIATFESAEDVAANERVLKQLIKKWLTLVDK